MIYLIVLAVLVVAVLLWLMLTYNRLVRLRNEAQQGFSGIDIQLKRRADLIPNLVEAVKAYAAHESGLFEELAKARADTLTAQGVAGAADAAGKTGAALGKLFAVAEAYPQLRASENFQRLQEELTDTEDKIAAARRYYNNVVQKFNTSQQTFPASLVAGTFGFGPREFFRIEEDGDGAPVAVSL
jgi:LemA protein